MPFTIIRDDITKMTVDAIVNAANTALQQGGGVCGAIFSAAGARELQTECDALAPIATGEAVITSGFKLPAKFIIHAAGPVYKDGKRGEETLLRSCYVNSLKLAAAKGCESIAFPLISSGIYGYPKEEALRVAAAAIQEFLQENDMDVYLAVFDRAAFAVSEKLLGAVQSYIDENYVDERYDPCRPRGLLEVERKALDDYAAPARRGLDDVVERLDEPFSTTLLRLIDAKGRTDVEVYKRANIDRKLFSKIRKGKDYTPSKKTAVALAIALELSLGETEDLLKRAGHALSHSVKFDVIVEYFISNSKHDVFEINEVLFHYDQPLLGA
ncbi:MAG: macro domain-containing protein [Synergistaceae bacterium]|jgi:O-acetyl-ADP-ribose deacetylase (regulator of RNase III)|nr:macro domain-containing protein [Synergistaceae bacterium]